MVVMWSQKIPHPSRGPSISLKSTLTTIQTKTWDGSIQIHPLYQTKK